MDPELLQVVSRQPIDSLILEPASVSNHARRWVLDDLYPVLVPEQGTDTLGLIIRGLSEEAMARIVFFEGEEFMLQPIVVRTQNGVSEQVQYFDDNQRKLISESEWVLSDWQRTTKAETMKRVERYMQCYGRMTAAEADRYW